MLTDLGWIGRGQEFPPHEEKRRIDGYKKNAHMYAGKYEKVFGTGYAVRANMLRIRDVDVRTVVNYPQLLTKKTADFVCGETPDISIDSALDNATDLTQKALDKMNFAWTLYEAMMDVSRYGNAVLKLGQDRVSITPPEHWYPVVDPYDKKRVTQQVIAFIVDRKIYVEIHEKGRYEERWYDIEQGSEGTVKFGQLLEANSVQTNIDDFAVQVLSNVTSSDSLFGTSDYDIIEGTLEQLLWRIFTVERILDKHAAPSIVGSSSMLQKDPVTGLLTFRSGNFITRDSNDVPAPQYLTWDGNLDSVRWEIEWLTNQMYTLSEMGAAFLTGEGKGEANSARALRLRMVAPIIKARRLAGINDMPVKQVVRIVALLNGVTADIGDVSLVWNDGLPNDMMEDAELYERATAGKQIMSQFEAVKRFNHLDDEGTDRELELIANENAGLFDDGMPDRTEDVRETVFIEGQPE